MERRALLAHRQAQVVSALKVLAERVEALAKAEKKVEVTTRSVVRQNPVVPEGVARVKKECIALRLAAELIEVASEYYTWTLQERCTHLAAPSVYHLCKSIILENTASTQTDCSNPRNARFYMVLISYASRLHSHKVFRFVRSLSNLPRKRFHFRLADDALSSRLSGFGHNAIPPIALAERVPLILDQKITAFSPPNFYAGGLHPVVMPLTAPAGGHVDWKLRVGTSEFVRATACFVADVTHDGEGEGDASADSGEDE